MRNCVRQGKAYSRKQSRDPGRSEGYNVMYLGKDHYRLSNPVKARSTLPNRRSY